MVPPTCELTSYATSPRGVSRPGSQPDIFITDQADVSSPSVEASSAPDNSESRPRDLHESDTQSLRTTRQASRGHLKRKEPPDATTSSKRTQLDVRPSGGRSTDASPKIKLSACHQCRRTTKHCKMACTNVKSDGDRCSKKYCTICIGKRYPNITFESNCRSFVCPACSNTCNCSFCTRKRGEVYYGERTGGLTAHPAAAKAKEKTTSIPPTDPNLDANAKTYWATVYGITGEKVARAFVSEDGNDNVIFARPITNPEIAVFAPERQGSSVDSILSDASAEAEDKDGDLPLRPT